MYLEAFKDEGRHVGVRGTSRCYNCERVIDGGVVWSTSGHKAVIIRSYLIRHDDTATYVLLLETKT